MTAQGVERGTENRLKRWEEGQRENLKEVAASHMDRWMEEVSMVIRIEERR